MKKLIEGVAYNSMGKHRAFIDGKKTKAYQVWRSMLQRCYDKKFHKDNPTYIGCSVCEEWLDFQNFASWYVDHKYGNLGYQLDKDLLVPNNKVYSPDTCCLIPRDLNVLLIDSRAIRGEYPQGVHFFKPTSRYAVQIRINGKQNYLGLFDTPEEASLVYKTAKEAHVKTKANEWRDRIAPEVYEALMAWRL